MKTNDLWPNAVLKTVFFVCCCIDHCVNQNCLYHAQPGKHTCGIDHIHLQESPFCETSVLVANHFKFEFCYLSFSLQGIAALAVVMSQHTDASKNTTTTLKCCYALHSYVGTVFRHDKLLALQHQLSRNADESLEDSMWLPIGSVTKGTVTHTILPSSGWLLRMYKCYILGELHSV